MCHPKKNIDMIERSCLLLIFMTITSVFPMSHSSCEAQIFAVKDLMNARDSANALTHFFDRISKIDRISYYVNRVDTFPSGNVWNSYGKCILRRDVKDSTFGFEYYGIRIDKKKANIYVNRRHFRIDDNLGVYSIEKMVTKHILGAPGGQMVVIELLNIAKDYSEAKIVENKKDHFIIRVDYKNKDSFAQKNTFLFISKRTFLPFKIRTIAENYQPISKWITEFNISSIEEEVLALDSVFSSQFLARYKLNVEANQAKEKVVIGTRAPKLKLTDINSNDSIYLDKFKGQRVLLYFWEIWCAPCIKSLPKIDLYAKELQKKNIVLLGISSKKNDIKTKAHLSRYKIGFSQYCSDNAVKAFNIIGFPTYVLIDENGFVKSVRFNLDKELMNEVQGGESYIKKF